MKGILKTSDGMLIIGTMENRRDVDPVGALTMKHVREIRCVPEGVSLFQLATAGPRATHVTLGTTSQALLFVYRGDFQYLAVTEAVAAAFEAL